MEKAQVHQDLNNSALVVEPLPYIIGSVAHAASNQHSVADIYYWVKVQSVDQLSRVFVAE